MADSLIDVKDQVVEIHNLQIHRKDVADYFREVPSEDRELAFIQAIEVGVYCLERSKASQDTEFIKRQIESLMGNVEKAISTIPGETQKELVSKLGTEEGQVLAPVKSLVTEVKTATTDRLKEVQTLLAQEIDPSKEGSTINKALGQLKNLLDPNRTDSIQGSFNAALSKATAHDGAFAELIKKNVTDTMKPLADELDRLGKQIQGVESAEEAMSLTTAKGATYEEEVVVELQSWAKVAGAEVHHVGMDNQPGDILVKLPHSSFSGKNFSIVVEAKDRPSDKFGRRRILDSVKSAITERDAHAAIYLCKNSDGLAQEIGEWAEGSCESGPYIATTHQHLTTAIRFLHVQDKVASMADSYAGLDSDAIYTQIEQVKTALRRINNISTEAGKVRSSANSIEEEAHTLREEIRNSLSSIEDAVKAAVLEQSEPAVA